jgi:hypothetical protein
MRATRHQDGDDSVQHVNVDGSVGAEWEEGAVTRWKAGTGPARAACAHVRPGERQQVDRPNGADSQTLEPAARSVEVNRLSLGTMDADCQRNDEAKDDQCNPQMYQHDHGR